MVEPRTLPGFAEYMPTEQIQFNNIRKIIQDTYESFGFLPLDTPVLELSDVLLAKAGGETEKQIYRFEKGDSDLSMRFDLTVPLAKYVAKNYGELQFPFRRYQISKVFRGERPQKGRFREFYQADIDIIGDGELALANDSEIPSVIYEIFKKLNFGKFTICINNRKVLTGFFEELGLTDKSVEVLRIIDKIAKIGEENVRLTLRDLEVSDENIDRIMNFISISGSNTDKINAIKNMISNEESTFSKGVYELETVYYNAIKFGIPEENLNIDLTIARGLDYYTGTVYETFLDEYREIGSVCSGGRYDNLAEFYTDKKLPGVGISIGLTRLFYKLEELGILGESENKSISKVLIAPFDNNGLDFSCEISKVLREAGISNEIYLEDKKIKTKFKYADKLQIPYVIVIGDSEIAERNVTLKNLNSGEQKTITLEELIGELK